MRIIGIDLGSRSVKIVVFEKITLLKRECLIHLFYRNYCSIIEGKISIDFNKLKLGEFEKSLVLDTEETMLM